MADILLRAAESGDMPGMLALWHKVFGDPPELIKAFQELLPEIGTAAVAVEGSQPVGAAYAITAMELVRPGAEPLPCAYVYSVAVDPAHRDKGLGAKLSILAADLAKERGAELTCTLPAEDSLYPWYEKVLGVEQVLSRRRLEGLAGEKGGWRKAGALEYGREREKLLEGREHQRLKEPCLRFAESFFGCFEGGLYTRGDALAAAYGDEKSLYIRELLTAEGQDVEKLAAELCGSLGRERFILDIPGTKGAAYLSARPGMIAPDCFWSFCFD